jgi:hypothetical protein
MNTLRKEVTAVLFSIVASLFGTRITFAANTLPTNPLGFQYGTIFTNDSSYYNSTGMLIASTCNAGDSHFQDARAAGAEVLEYIDPVDVPDDIALPCSLSANFYAWSALWPYPTTSPGSRVNYMNTHIGDVSVGSAWADAVVTYVVNLMISGKVDGVFVDVLGARLWTSANWDAWPTAEQNAFTDGAVDLVRRLDAARREINPRFIIVNNNTWYDGVNTRGLAGEWYVDGVCLEHHSSTPPGFNTDYAGRTFGNLGHRRMLAIATSTSDAVNWATIQGVTHVSDQQTYSNPGPPPIGFHPLTDRASTPQFFGQTTVGPTPSAGLNADYKRGSKFTINQAFKLIGLSAYLDGLGASTGSQQVLMELYSDSSGVPGTRLAVSNTISIVAGQVAGWVHFSTPATSLAAGTYWIVIQTGATTGIIHDYGASASGGSWYGNADPFSTSGGSNPFGSGTPGSGSTMSVYAVYTP